MFISGFTIARNVVKADYPIREAIYSILPLCDEIIVAIGKSEDDTLAYIKSFNEPKIKIIETIWDDNLRDGGKVLALETDKAKFTINPKADWCLYIQADECLDDRSIAGLKLQLEKYKEIIKKKLVAANIYDFYLKDNKNLKLIKLNKNYRNSYWVYIIEIIKGTPIIRNKIISFLEKNGIEVRRSFYPLHSMQPYKNFFKKKDFTISIQKSGNCICLPCWPGLRKEQIQRISKTINKFFVKTNL